MAKQLDLNSFVAILCFACGLATTLEGSSVDTLSVEFTTDSLGLGSDELNISGSAVAADRAGFITSTDLGVGSVLSVQQDGTAGLGTLDNRLLVTVTAKTYLDVTDAPVDFHAAVLSINDDDKSLRKEGLGVRAFKFSIDDEMKLHRINALDGSKHVSGGTDSTSYAERVAKVKKDGILDGAPHVDEAVYFDFNTPVAAQSLRFLLTDYKYKLGSKDMTKIDLTITLASGELLSVGTVEPSKDQIAEGLFTAGPEDESWWLNLSGIGELEDGDVVDVVTIMAVDDNPLEPKETAEHFFIHGLEVAPVPEPATASLVAFGGLVLVGRRIRRKIAQ